MSIKQILENEVYNPVALDMQGAGTFDGNELFLIYQKGQLARIKLSDVQNYIEITPETLNKPLLLANGTVLLPALAWGGNPDTGFYWISSGKIGYSSNGVALVEFDGNGLITDVINELTADHGVIIDGLTIIDGGITWATQVGTAVGSTTTDALVTTSNYVDITNVASSAVGVRISVLYGVSIIKNSAANSFNLYPVTGKAFDGGSANAPITILIGEIYMVISSTGGALKTIRLRGSDWTAGAESSNAITLQGTRGTITTSSLTNAGGGNYVITLTNASITATSHIKYTLYGYSGTMTTNGIPVLIPATPGSGTVVLNVANAHSANALSGTVKIDFEITNL